MGTEVKMMSAGAAADFLSTGAVEVPIFEREILDVVRRESVTLNRLSSAQTPATGHPHRYFEQTAIATAAAVDPRNLSATPTGPTRVERYLPIKAATAQSNLSLFDKDVTEQQGQFASVVAKDVDDIISGITIKRAQMFWTGSDTSLTTPTTLEWMGALAQISGSQTIPQVTIGAGSSIIDGIKSEIAALMSQAGYVVRPTAIYLNPTLADLIDKEAKASRITLDSVEVVAGVTVSAISTQAGKLPLVADVFMPTDTAAKYGFSAPAAGYQNYYAVILMEKLVEMPVISGREYNPNPRLFQLGLVGNLSGQFVGVMFDSLVIKGATYAHAVLAVVRK